MIQHINKKIMSIDAEKAFDKIQCTFLIKTLIEAGTEATQLNKINAIHDKLTANITLSGLSSKIRNKTKMSPLTTFTQHGPSHSNQTSKRNKRHSNWKGNKIITIYI